MLVLSKPFKASGALGGPESTTFLDDVLATQGGVHGDAAALLLAVASAWAYSDRTSLAEMIHLCVGPNTCEEIGVTNPALLVDTTAFFLRGDGAAPGRRWGVLVFRGTEFGTGNLLDVLTDVIAERAKDAQFGAAQLPVFGEVDALVHGGFHRALRCIWNRVVEVLEQNAADLDAFFITGHSLGGALAALAAARLFIGRRKGATGIDRRTEALGAKLRPAFRGLYTYGQPMVGNVAFAKLCDERGLSALTFRHVYRKDWVPTLPPLTTGLFWHFGKERRGSRSGAWTPSRVPVLPSWSAITTLPIAASAFVFQQLPLLRAVPLPNSLADHVPQYYVDCAKRALPPEKVPDVP